MHHEATLTLRLTCNPDAAPTPQPVTAAKSARSCTPMGSGTMSFALTPSSPRLRLACAPLTTPQPNSLKTWRRWSRGPTNQSTRNKCGRLGALLSPSLSAYYRYYGVLGGLLDAGCCGLHSRLFPKGQRRRGSPEEHGVLEPCEVSAQQTCLVPPASSPICVLRALRRASGGCA